MLKSRGPTRQEVAGLWLSLRLAMYVLQAESLLDRLLTVVFEAPASAR